MHHVQLFAGSQPLVDTESLLEPHDLLYLSSLRVDHFVLRYLTEDVFEVEPLVFSLLLLVIVDV